MSKPPLTICVPIKVLEPESNADELIQLSFKSLTADADIPPDVLVKYVALLADINCALVYCGIFYEFVGDSILPIPCDIKAPLQQSLPYLSSFTQRHPLRLFFGEDRPRVGPMYMPDWF